MPLPETCKHHYSCQESDKWGGVPYSVDLSERMEVTCLEGESSRLNWRKMWGKELNTLLNRSESFPFKNPSADATIIQCHPLAGFLWKKPELKKVSIEKAWFQQSLCAWGRVCVYLRFRLAVITERTGVFISWIHFRPAISSAISVHIPWQKSRQQGCCKEMLRWGGEPELWSHLHKNSSDIFHQISVNPILMLYSM